DEEKLRQLAIIEEAELSALAAFVAALQAVSEGPATLLDRSIVFCASNLGNASAHTIDNLPILLAGGGFRHVGHVAFDRKQNTPLSNLFVRMARQMGVDLERFGTSTGAVDEV